HREYATDGFDQAFAQAPHPLRVQPPDFTDAFVIEFEDQAAADRYAKHPAHDAWYKIYLPVRAESRSFQVTN
ncbi:MAG: Dabb family protein, partial [Bryobacteraceae bacterium]|nr:Dabb family protein [Bryobacteraceae bacterium]